MKEPCSLHAMRAHLMVPKHRPLSCQRGLGVPEWVHSGMECDEVGELQMAGRDSGGHEGVALDRRGRHHFTSHTRAALGPHLPLLASGIAIEILLLVMYSAASRLNWYPSRLGPPAEWLDQHFYPLIAPLLSVPFGPPGMVPILVFFVTLAIMFGIYILAMHYAQLRGAGNRTSFCIVLGISVLFMASLLLQPYISSQDIFSYAFYAHISGLYGSNPYVAVPRDFPFDPLFGAIFWKDQPSNYGPLWTYITTFITLFTGTNTALTLVGIKLVVILFALAGVPLIWQILGQISPNMRLAGTVLYAWNPLLILETAGSGHNDSVVGFFVLLSLFLYGRKAKLGGIAALILSVLTKYVTAVLLPLYLLLWLRECTGIRDRLIALCKFGAVTVGLLTIAYIPVYRGAATFQIASFGTNPSNYINSPLELVFREIRVVLGDSREAASLPLRYRAWWVTTNRATALWSRPDASNSTTVILPTSSSLMVVAPRQGPWLHVYAPGLDQFGYVREAATAPAPAPSFASDAGAASILAQTSSSGTNFERANLILRVTSSALFLLLLLLLARRTTTYSSLIYSSAAALFASYWLLQTWFWPWYLVWALPLAALVPHTRVTALMVAFSLTTLGLHAQLDIPLVPYMDAAYEYRSLAIFGIPVILVAAWLAISRLHGRSTRPVGSKSRTRLKIAAGTLATLAVVLLVGFVGIKAQAQSKAEIAEISEEEFSEQSLDWVDHYWAGMQHFNNNQYQEAIQSLSRAIEEQPDYMDAYRIRFLAYLHTGRIDEAIEDMSRILAAEGDDLDLLLARGSAYRQIQSSGLALKDFAHAISLDPPDPRAYRSRAETYHELGLINEAIASEQQALAISPYSAVLYRELAGMHATLGHFQEALSLYNTAIWLDKYDAESYVGRASILRILGRGEETIPDLREVLALSNDEDVRTWARRTIAAVSGADANKAENDLRLGP
ncbi:MAG: tetratricopeptide repeat protein [Chloroflexi bacterium]|nr:tetratricopeptide repeat protein [Chloroflexota bacterium]